LEGWNAGISAPVNCARKISRDKKIGFGILERWINGSYGLDDKIKNG